MARVIVKDEFCFSGAWSMNFRRSLRLCHFASGSRGRSKRISNSQNKYSGSSRVGGKTDTFRLKPKYLGKYTLYY